MVGKPEGVLTDSEGKHALELLYKMRNQLRRRARRDSRNKKYTGVPGKPQGKPENAWFQNKLEVQTRINGVHMFTNL